MTEDIRSALDSNNLTCGVFINLRKAFDTVDHPILLSKLYHYGICGSANDWFKSYMTNRQQFVSISGHNSDKLNMSFGVPKGQS